MGAPRSVQASTLVLIFSLAGNWVCPRGQIFCITAVLWEGFFIFYHTKTWSYKYKLFLTKTLSISEIPFHYEKIYNTSGCFSKLYLSLKTPSELECRAKMKADEWLYELIHSHWEDPFDVTMDFPCTVSPTAATALMHPSSSCLDLSLQVFCSHSRTHRGEGSSREDSLPRCWVQNTKHKTEKRKCAAGWAGALDRQDRAAEEHLLSWTRHPKRVNPGCQGWG